MHLFTNGCSWTYGGGLGLDREEDTEQRLTSVWPKHLSDLMGTEVTNLAVGCGSNQRIIRTTYEWLLEQTPETLANTVAIIQWTEPSRYEYYIADDESDWLENNNRNWAKAKIGVCVQNVESRIAAAQRNNLRLQTWSLQESMYQQIMHCEALASLFKRFNVKFFYWSFVNDIKYQPEHIRQYHLDNFPWLDIHVNGEPEWIYDRVSEQDKHPSFTGHKQIAEIIYSMIKDKL